MLLVLTCFGIFDMSLDVSLSQLVSAHSNVFVWCVFNVCCRVQRVSAC